MSLFWTMAFRVWRGDSNPRSAVHLGRTARFCALGGLAASIRDHPMMAAGRAGQARTRCNPCPMCHAGAGFRVALRVARDVPPRAGARRGARLQESWNLFGYFERLVDPY